MYVCVCVRSPHFSCLSPLNLIEVILCLFSLVTAHTQQSVFSFLQSRFFHFAARDSTDHGQLTILVGRLSSTVWQHLRTSPHTTKQAPPKKKQQYNCNIKTKNNTIWAPFHPFWFTFSNSASSLQTTKYAHTASARPWCKGRHLQEPCSADG